MTDPNPLIAARNAIDDCEVALEDLEARCCRPERSPRMKALAETIAAVRSGLEDVGNGDHHGAVDATITHIEDAGAQIGWLQVGCCAPNRLPLYHTLLEGLTTTQRSIKKAAGAGH
jgi:hypothetical protein